VEKLPVQHRAEALVREGARRHDAVVAKEDSIILSLLRRFLGPLFGLVGSSAGRLPGVVRGRDGLRARVRLRTDGHRVLHERLAGSLLSAALSPGPSVGASGAIFGVVAAVVVVLYRHQERFSLRDKRIGFVLLVWAGYQISTGLLNPYIDNYGHLGGLAGGGSTALLLEPSLLSRRSRR